MKLSLTILMMLTATSSKTTLPANSKGQRMWYTYRYEPVMNMYVERIDDAFGYRSEAANSTTDMVWHSAVWISTISIMKRI